MFFFLAFMLVFVGIFIAGLQTFMPLDMIFTMPQGFGYLLFIFGIVLAGVGLFLLYARASKVGATHLIAPGKPEKILWFYIYKDDTLRIVPARRDVEGFSHSKQLDAEVQELKSYRLQEHSVRIVPEGIGHCVDLNACIYAYFLKTKKGFKTISDARAESIKALEETKDTKEENINTQTPIPQERPKFILNKWRFKK